MATSHRIIKKVAVLGSGVMGSRIACHFANIGCEVLLLDIVPNDLKEEEKNKPAARNRIVNESLQATFKANPAALYHKKFASRIQTGNFDDDLSKIKNCDWVLEAVVERLDIKQQLYAKVEQHRRAGSLITSNTSGIPIHLLAQGRSDDFKANFCGTHFFNPPRYLRLLEIIPTPDTRPEVVDFLMHYGDLFFGKTTVLCKDTPGFIANRIGVFGMMATFKLMGEMDMTPTQVDSLTGTIAGRPKSATFRTADVVGLDTLIKVAKGLYDSGANDEARNIFLLPDYLKKMEENKWLGDKTKQGFFKKDRDEKGKSIIKALNLKTMEYEAEAKTKFAAVEAAKPIENLRERLKVLHGAGDKAAEFLNKLAYQVFQYCSFRIPEIADHLYQIDDAMRAGFGWELGPFELWDVLGVEKTVKKMSDNGNAPAAWVQEMLAKGISSFYKSENGKRFCYQPATQQYEAIAGTEALIMLDNFRAQKPVWSNSGTTLHDIGDGVLCLEFHTKMNAIGGEVLEGINKAIDIAEQEGWKGLVIGNDSQTFSAGANLGLIYMFALEQEFDELDIAIRMFQNTMMRLRFCNVPTVAAPHGLTLGGGCELSMHCDRIVAAAETYIGLVEVGVGVIPGGGGTKEFVLRASDRYFEGDIEIPTLQKYLLTIGKAEVATSAYEAYDLGIMQAGKDTVTLNLSRQLADAKEAVLELYNAGYTAPTPRTDIKVLGRQALGSLIVGIEQMKAGNFISEYDAHIAKKLAYVMCGGDLSQPTLVSEQYLLDLERETFLSLLTERKTLERIQSILTSGKPLRN